MTIVIAEHNITLRKRIRQILERNGHCVLAEAQNGLHAYNKYMEYQPELVIVSLEMPIYDGMSTVEKIIDVNPNAKIVMLGNRKNNRKLYKAIERGAKHFISIPLEEKKVLSIIDAVGSL